MLLRVPAGDMADVVLRERHEREVVAIGPAEGAEELVPLVAAKELIRVVEGVAGLVTHVHHDLALVLDVVDGVLEVRDARIAEVEGDADDGLLGRTAPFVGEVAARPKAAQPCRVEFPVKLADERRDRRALQGEPELPDRHRQQLLRLGGRFLERDHC